MDTRPGGITQWVELVQAEYNEMPGLQLTKPQVRRWWGLGQPTCDTLLGVLEEAHFLRRTERDAYVRIGIGR